MISTSVTSTVYFAPGLKYPPAVAKAAKEQQEAETQYVEALAKLAESEAALEIARATDRADLEEAARTNAGPPTKSHEAGAQSDAAYWEVVATQAQTRYSNAGSAASAALAAHADEILPLAIAAARTARERYDDTIAAAHRTVGDANTILQNAASALNMLRPHLRHLANYSVNFVPVAISVPDSRSLGNMQQIADQLERAKEAHDNPAPELDRWPIGGGTETDSGSTPMGTVAPSNVADLTPDSDTDAAGR